MSFSSGCCRYWGKTECRETFFRSRKKSRRNIKELVDESFHEKKYFEGFLSFSQTLRGIRNDGEILRVRRMCPQITFNERICHPNGSAKSCILSLFLSLFSSSSKPVPYSFHLIPGLSFLVKTLDYCNPPPNYRTISNPVTRHLVEFRARKSVFLMTWKFFVSEKNGRVLHEKKAISFS